jgi:hypothetical protein
MAPLIVLWFGTVLIGLPLPLLHRRCWTIRQWAKYVALLLGWPVTVPYAIVRIQIQDGRHVLLAALFGWRVVSMMAVPQWQWQRRLVVRQPSGREAVWFVGDDQ